MKIALLIPFLGQAMLSWTPPTTNTDGSPLTNLAGYKVYWSTSPGSYPNSVQINDPGLSSYVVDQLSPATWYFVVSAFNTGGRESDFSNVASKVVTDELRVKPESLAYLVFTIRNQIIFVEAGAPRLNSFCDPEQVVRGLLPPDSAPTTLNLVAAEEVELLPSIPSDGELALFAECQ